MKHTKGPWKVFYASNGSMLGVGVERSGTGVTDAYGGLWGSGGEKEANAHLIAAAPELLDIAERMMEALEFAYMGAPEQPKEIAQYRAIRAKIVGKQ